MPLPHGSRALLCVALAALSAGCTRIADHQVALLDEQLLAAVQPGVDTRESVAGTLGRPSFVGQFDSHDWYYVSRNTRQLAFNLPHPSEETVLHVRFDDAGNVQSVNRTGLELVVNINPSHDKTPTLGNRRSLFQELFGNIGAVGQAGEHAPTTDNPNGN
jgi:outer membrane protein assembly factor BamE (lipoprotein component of BamABCDE complex)